MTQQHTPGSWKYSLNVGPTKALIVEMDGSTVVEIGNRTHDSRFTANVRLIAAAPDLLAALEDAESFIAGFEGDEMQDGIDDLLGAIRAAIAKARREG